jgi:hypothetical protein
MSPKLPKFLWKRDMDILLKHLLIAGGREDHLFPMVANQIAKEQGKPHGSLELDGWTDWAAYGGIKRIIHIGEERAEYDPWFWGLFWTRVK